MSVPSAPSSSSVGGDYAGRKIGMRWVLLVLALAALVAAACSGGSSPAPTSVATLAPSRARTPAPAPPSTPAAAQRAAAVIGAAQGGEVSLPDGTRITVPAGAVASDLTVALDEQPTTVPPVPSFAAAVGTLVNVDLQGQSLMKPATLELPYDPSRVSSDTPEGAVFASYFDEAKQEWVPVGGVVDTQRHVVVVQTAHASWWAPWTWITDAVIQGIVTALKLDFSSILDAAEAFSGCADSAQGVIIDESSNKDYLGSCVEVDDPVHPRLRIVNRRTFDVDAYPLPGTVWSDLPNPGEPMGRLERRSFNVDYSNAPVSDPLVVRAEVDWPYTLGHAVLDVIHLIPGMDLLLDQDKELKILLEVAGNSHIQSAASAAAAGDQGALQEALFQAFLDQDLAQRVGDILGVGGTSLFVVFKALGVAGVGIQIADAVKSAMLGPGEVSFYSNRPIKPQTGRTCPVADDSFCEFVRELEAPLGSADVGAILQRTVLHDCASADVWDDGCGSDASCVEYGALQGEGGCTPISEFKRYWGNEVKAPLSICGIVYPRLAVPWLDVEKHSYLSGPVVLVTNNSDPRFDLAFFTQKLENGWRITAILLTGKNCGGESIPRGVVLPWP